MVETGAIPLVDIGAVVLVALVLGTAFSRARLSSSIGYIIAGLILGPLGLRFLVPGQGLAPAFGELGLLLLLFYLGLELSVRRFRETGAMSTVLSVADMAISFAAGFAIAKVFGLGDIQALVVGAMLPATSTVHAVDFLLERGLGRKPESRLVESGLVLKDFAAILVVVLLSALGAQRALNVAALNALLFVVAAFFVVSRVSHRVLNFLHEMGQSDKMALYAIGIGIGVSYFGVFLGLSSAIGAYFAGFALAETVYGERIKREMRFLREFFILFFFVTFGSSVFVDSATGQALVPAAGQLWLIAALAAALLVVYLLLKMLSYGILGTALGMSAESSLTVGTLLVPLGEFALIITASARPLLDPASYGTLLAVAFTLVLATAIATPLLYARVGLVSSLFLRLYPEAARRSLSRAAVRVEALEKVLQDRLLQLEYLRTVKSIAMNLLIAIAIVYLSNIVRVEVVLPLLPFVPASVSMGALILPLLVWPVYRILLELRFLAHAAARRMFVSAFPQLAHKPQLEHQASEVFTGLLLVAVGVLASATVYYALPGEPLYLLLPVLYTLLALMFLSKSLYGAVGEFAVAETVLPAGEGALAGSPSLLRLSREFNERSRGFQELRTQRAIAMEQVQEALLAGDAKRARGLLASFRRREASAAKAIIGKAGKARAPTTEEALESYLVSRSEEGRAAAKERRRRGAPKRRGNARAKAVVARRATRAAGARKAARRGRGLKTRRG